MARRIVPAFVLSAFLAWPSLALSEGGCLDSSFGAGGKVVTDFTAENDEINAIALQPDGKIVAVGWAGVGPSVPVSSFALARYNPDGSLDLTFGSGGKVDTNFSGNNDAATGVALQPDGKILVSGSVAFDPLDADSAVARYLPDGTLDASFGVGGLVTIDFDHQHNGAVAMVLQPDLKIVTLNSINVLAFDTRWALVRYNPDGSPDGTFGSGGTVITNPGPLDDRPTALALQADGKILATGLTLQGSNNQVVLVRYETNGNLDATFGSGGIVMTGFPGENAGGFDLEPLASGEILVAGQGPGSGADLADFLVLRYNPDGSLDATFGASGMVFTDFKGSTDGATGIAVDSAGRILAVGHSFGGTSGSDFAMARYNADGSLDLSFGTGGKVLTDFFGGGDGAVDILFQLDGKIVLGGVAAYPPDEDFPREFALARYLGDGCNRPPVCSMARPSLSRLWPPNHSLQAISILGVTDPDDDPVAIAITGITQDEPTHGLGGGDTGPDGFGVGTSTAQLRAERSGSGNGRVYAVEFSASDGRGGLCTGAVLVGIPHDQGRGSVPVDDGQLYDSTLP